MTEPTPCSYRRQESGVALIAVLLILSLLMGLAATLTTSVLMDTSLRGAFQRTTTGFYAAESGLNRGMGSYRNIFLGFRVPTSANGDFLPQSFPLGRRTVTYQLFAANPDGSGNATPTDVTIPAGQLFAGLHSLEYTYIVNSQAVANGETEATVSAEFNVGNIPIFQFAAFYADDLEIMPGANMHLHGRVHTNGDLYLNSDAHLWIEDNPPDITTVQVTAKGAIHRGRKDNPSVCGGTVTIDKLQDTAWPLGNLDPQDMTCSGGATSAIPLSTLSTWKGSIVSNIQSISVPQPDIITKPPQNAGVFWTHADLRIVLKLGQPGKLPGAASSLPDTIEVEDATGAQDVARTASLYKFMTDRTFNASFSSSMTGTRPIFYTAVPKPNAICTCADGFPNCNPTIPGCYTPPFSASSRPYSGNINISTDFDYRRGGFYDQREKRWITMLNVNLHDLLAWNLAQSSSNRLFDPKDTSDGGLVLYLSVVGPDSAGINNYGVRLFGSASLPFPGLSAGADPTGVTVVTDQAVYVLGNYNSVAPKQPAAIIGDSVNVLSNNYFNKPGSACTNDCQSAESFGSSDRQAVTTTINAAFLGGVDDTKVGQYNGGLENYPRFHENWSGDTLYYRGSFVSLGTPVHVNGAWHYGDPVYTAPNRQYDYDPDFNDVANLPPLTPTFVYVQQVLFTEDFK